MRDVDELTPAEVREAAFMVCCALCGGGGDDPACSEPFSCPVCGGKGVIDADEYWGNAGQVSADEYYGATKGDR